MTTKERVPLNPDSFCDKKLLFYLSFKKKKVIVKLWLIIKSISWFHLT